MRSKDFRRIAVLAVFATAVVLVFASTAYPQAGTYYWDRTWVTVPDTCWWAGNVIFLPINMKWEADHYYHFPSGYSPGQHQWLQNHACFDEFKYDADRQMFGFHLRIEFDPYVVQFVLVDSAGLIRDWNWPKPAVNYDNMAGWVEISDAYHVGGTLPTVEQALIYAGFMVTGVPGNDAKIRITSFRYNEIDMCPDPAWNNCGAWHKLQPIIIDCAHIGPLDVCEFIDLCGRVTYCANGLEMGDVLVTLEYIPASPTAPNIADRHVMTPWEPDCGFNCGGTYCFTNIIGGYEYCVHAWKDNDERDAIDAFDAALLLQHLVGAFNLNCCKEIAADVSGNCDLSPWDASLILQKAVGLIDYFPKTLALASNWVFVPSWHFVNGRGDCICPPEEWCFNPLVEDQENIDLSGILLGDISGNWGLSWPKVPIPEGQVVYVEPRTNANGSVQAAVKIDFDGGARAIQATIVYDSENYRIAGINRGDAMANWLFEANAVGNTVKVAAASAQRIEGLSQVVVLDLEPVSGTAKDPAVSLSYLNVDGNTIIDMAPRADVSLPSGFSLKPNYPNPFNPETVIGYTLDRSAHVTIDVVNLLGQSIAVLVDREHGAGEYSVTWNGLDRGGNQVSSGIYFYRMKADNFVESRKMMLMK